MGGLRIVRSQCFTDMETRVQDGQVQGPRLEPNEPLLRLGIGQVRDRIDREGTRARDCVTKVGPEAGLV